MAGDASCLIGIARPGLAATLALAATTAFAVRASGGPRGA